ncbi:serine/threonine-protein kinase [Thermopolyspora sp. NPDC052614]|uniref:serine/threonine protein kinase n=1 Tax=Thermopolyspora sp. NPDC052614 TaxID=3155682 RepID=UPI003446318E
MEPGDVLSGRFRITGFLKGGGMARVWAARDLRTEEPVVVKVLGRDLWDGAMPHTDDGLRLRSELLQRFERERRLLHTLRGPGIPTLIHYDFGVGEPYLVMEHIAGKNLREFLNRNRPPLCATAAIAVRMAETLQRVHTAGVIHRDLKPGNVLLTDDGHVYLIDFGIALPTDPEATRYTEYGQTPGSVGYKAPEVIRGVKDLTLAADTYSLGCILFECIAACRVFEELPDRGIEDQHRNDPPPRLDPEWYGIPAALSDLIRRMLDKDPGNRPSVAETRDGFAPLLPRPGDRPPTPTLNPDPTLPYRTGRTPETALATPMRTSRPRSVSRRPPRPVRQEFTTALERAERELAEEGPGPASERLARELDSALRAWGPREPLVARARLLCADRARVEGDWPGAGALYRDVERALRDRAETELRDLWLEARIGVAECLVPAQGHTGDAFLRWKAVVLDLRGLPRPPAKVVRRCREFGEELGERGHLEEVEALLDGLPPA